MTATSVAAYLDALPADRKAAMQTLRSTIEQHLPEGFEETMPYRMPSRVVPHSRYPDGSRFEREEPLPFLSIANQKNFVALDHVGIYADPELLRGFETEWSEHVSTKLDMGKSCIRFEKVEQDPFELFRERVSRVSVDHWVAPYESRLRG